MLSTLSTSVYCSIAITVTITNSSIVIFVNSSLSSVKNVILFTIINMELTKVLLIGPTSEGTVQVRALTIAA